MNEWIMVFAGSALAGIIVYVWQRHQVARVEREKSVAETELAAQRSANEQLRRDDAAVLGSQAGQYNAQIADLNGKLREAQERTDEAMAEVRRLESASKEAKAAQDAERRRIADMEKHYRETQETAKAQFEALAQKILDEKSARLGSQGKEQLEGVVAGLAKDIKAFREKIDASDIEAAKNNTALGERITQLVNQTNAVSSQANNLALAIRGDAQLTGEWGEIQLKQILDGAGFAEGSGYSYQETFHDADDKRKRTDFIVKMPGEKNLIVDSKNTVAGITEFHAASTKEEKKKALWTIVDSLENHIEEIVNANYTSAVPNAFPVVLMYVPVDEVYILAMKSRTNDNTELIREYAARNNIVLVNSASVIPVARLVKMMWESENGRQNAKAIIASAQELLRRCNAFIEDFMAMGDALGEVLAKYNGAKNKLVDAPRQQSILKAVNELVDLGVEPLTKGGKPLTLNAAITDAAINSGDK